MDSMDSIESMDALLQLQDLRIDVSSSSCAAAVERRSISDTETRLKSWLLQPQLPVVRWPDLLDRL